MHRTGLLRIVSVLFLLWGIVHLLGILGISSCAGLAGGLLLGSVPAGFALGTLFQFSRLVSCIFMLVAGIAGLKAVNRSLCRFCAWIILICAVVSFSGSLKEGTSLFAALVDLALPILYFIGVRNAF